MAFVVGTSKNETVTPWSKSPTVNTNTTHSNDSVYMYGGDDWVNAGNGNDYVDGWTGNDHLDGWNGNDTLYGFSGNDTLLGYYGNDKLYGESGNDTLKGESGNDLLDGGTGNDILDGGAGNDTLVGGAGKDTLTGGAGNDRFDYNSVSESGVGVGNRDIIQGFNFGGVNSGDKIDLSTIDANFTLGGNQAFKYIDTDPFSAPGQVRVADVGQATVIQLNVDFDLDAESEIQVNDGTITASYWADFDFFL